MSYEPKLQQMCQQVKETIIKRQTPEHREYNMHLYTIVRNYLKKEDFHIDSLKRIIGKTEEEIYEMLRHIGFSRARDRYWPNFGAVLWARHFADDFLKFLNYPIKKNAMINYSRIENLIVNPKRYADYRNVLVGAFESDLLKAISSNTIREIKSTLQIASSGHCGYIFKQIISIYTSEFPELLSFEKGEDYKDIQCSDEQEQTEVPEQVEIDVNDLLAQNIKINEELEQARANADFLDLQFESMQSRFKEHQLKIENDATLDFFKKLNSIENSNLLNSFFLAKSSLDNLRASKWIPEPNELESILFFYDLFLDFLKRQDVWPQFTIGQIVDVTIDNINDFEYTGSEITPETITKARVKVPALYLDKKSISKAKVVEVRQQR
jgi:hypothetical protein